MWSGRCCDEIHTLETRGLTIKKSDENINYQIHIGARPLDSAATYGVSFINSGKYNTASRYADYVYFHYISPLGDSIGSGNITKLKSFDSLTLNNKVFNKVFKFEGQVYYETNRPYPRELYYTSDQGIVGFVLSDNTTWTLQ